MVSKTVWNLPGGPWTRLFAGTWGGFNVAVYENEDRILLTTIFPKSGEVNWVMIRVDKVLIVPEDVDRLAEELKHKNLHIIKHQFPGRESAFLLIPALPTTVEFGSKTINAEVMDKIVKLDEETNDIKQIAGKIKVPLVDLKDASYKESATIMGNPPLLLSLLKIAPEHGEEAKKQKFPEVPVGKDEKGAVFKISESFFDEFISVRQGTPDERAYAAQMIIEDAILDPSPIPLILDFTESPLRLDQPNPYPYEYGEYGIESQNTSFKFTMYDLSPTAPPLKIDLNQVSQQYLWYLLGIGKDESSSVIIQAYYSLRKSNKLDDIPSLLEEVKKTPCTNDRDRFFVSRAVRILELADKTYGPIFGRDSDFKKMVGTWIKENETAYLRLYDLNDKARLAFMIYLLELLDSLKGSSGLSLIDQKRVDHIFLSFIELDWLSDGVLEKQFMQMISSMSNGTLFVAEKSLPMELESRLAYKFGMTGPNEAKLQIGGKSSKIELRPLLSCPP